MRPNKRKLHEILYTENRKFRDYNTHSRARVSCLLFGRQKVVHTLVFVIRGTGGATTAAAAAAAFFLLLLPTHTQQILTFLEETIFSDSLKHQLQKLKCRH